MSAPKWILIGSVALFSIIGIAAVAKKSSKQPPVLSAPIKVAETPVIAVPVSMKPAVVHVSHDLKKVDSKEKKKKGKERLAASIPFTEVLPAAFPQKAHSSKEDLPNIDRIFQLFSTGSSKLPIVETVNYSSSAPWLKGRPAWISDYATYYNTSRHFIARSMNGKPDYFSQKVSEGSKFNVFRKDKKINFYLLVDVSRCKMAFYYVDLDTNERVLLKTYRVGLGRLDTSKPSGTATPLGRYTLGSRVAIYKPGLMGFYQDQSVEMIRVFGTRWIPLDQEIERVTSPAKGYGLQGAPWVMDSSGKLIENRDVIGAYDSDGCIRLSLEDIEELFSIVLTKQTFIEIVKDFHEAKLPGLEVAAPTR